MRGGTGEHDEAQADTPLRFGVVASFRGGGDQLRSAANAFVSAVSDALNREVIVEVTEDYQALSQAVLSRSIELAWMPPLLHLHATQNGAALLMVCRRFGAFGDLFCGGE